MCAWAWVCPRRQGAGWRQVTTLGGVGRETSASASLPSASPGTQRSSHREHITAQPPLPHMLVINLVLSCQEDKLVAS